MRFFSVFSFQVDLTDCACAAVAVVVRVRGQSISQSDVIEMMPKTNSPRYQLASEIARRVYQLRIVQQYC